MNSRQKNFIAELQKIADIKAALYASDKLYQQQWQEEFKTGKDNALDIVDLTSYGFAYSELNQFVNNILTHSITFWDGGAALSDVERGKFSRRIMQGNRYNFI